MATRVERYGLLPPVEGADLVDDQMRAGSRYYNDLIALERTRRVVYRDMRSRAVPALAEQEARVAGLSAEMDVVRGEIKAQHSASRGRSADRALKERAQALRVDLAAARKALAAARAEASRDATLREHSSALEERGKVWHKGLRANTPAYWGTYLLEEASAEQARKATVDPGFRRARGRERVRERAPGDASGGAEGRVGVQLQGGASPAELYACEDTRARIEPASDHGPWAESYDHRRPAYARLWLRVGSEGRAPVWAVWPLKMHRPLPADARVKGIVVKRRLVGLREEWYALVTYATESVPMPQRAGAVALDLGWRQRPDGSLRVLYWVDDQGEHGEVLMPVAIRERLRKASDLREIQDLAFNRVARRLAQWLSAAQSQALVPAWLSEECTQLGQWRSHARLRKVVVRWRQERFAGDAAIYARVEHWLHRSRHLYEWECEARENALAQRKDAYRNAAAQFARRYGTVVVEKFDLRRVRTLPRPEDDTAESHPAQRSQMTQAAPGELRMAIKNAVERDGGIVAEIDAGGTTSTCHACGAECAWDQASEIWHRCEHCGALWDQDRNAATNLLSLWMRERSGDAQTTAPARGPSKRAARFAKRHAKGDGADTAAE